MTPVKPMKNLLKPLAVLIPLFIASTSAQAYECDPERDLTLGTTYNQVLTPDPVTSADRLFLTPERLEAINTKRENGEIHYTTMVNVANAYLNELEESSHERVATYALLYRITGDQEYLDLSKHFFKKLYGSDPNWGWAEVCEGNNFRTDSKWAFMTYSWLYDEFTEEERAVMVKNFALWGEFWLQTALRTNPKGAKLRYVDSDLVTELPENLTALGLILKGTEISDRLFAAADKIFEEAVIPTYLQGIFAGGLWGEGPEYSAGTNVHWPLTFEINKAHRPEVYARYLEKGIDPSKFYNDSIEGLINTSLPGMRAVYENGDVQEAGYFPDGDWEADEHISKRIPMRYRSVAIFGGLTDSEHHKQLAAGYLSDIRKVFGSRSMRSLNPGVLEVLFQQSATKPMSPQVAGLPLTFLAEGTDVYAARSSWSDKDATSLYLTSNKSSVDHQNTDALNFDIARKGRWLTKEVVGYQGDAYDAIAHNTILIESKETHSDDGLIGGTCEGCHVEPVGDGDIIRQSESETFNYVVAEAAQLHNRFMYELPINYVEQLTRQIAHIKPDAYIVFDNVMTDKTKVGDFQDTKSAIDYADEYIRDVTLVQHFLSEPLLDDEGFYVSGDAESAQQIKFQSLLPVPDNITTTVVDENVYWSEVRPAFEWQIPLKARKWHLRINTAEKQEDTKFLSVLYTGDEGEVITPTQQILLNKNLREDGQAGYIPSYSADVTGVALEIKDEWHVVVFNDNPEIDLLSLHYDVSFIPESSIVNHYVLGAGSKERYSYEQTNGVFSVSERQSAGTEMDNNAGSLTVVTRDGVPFVDVEVPSVPQALVVVEPLESELTIEWDASIDKHVADGADYTATSYAVYRSDVSLTEPVAVVRGKSFANSGLTAETAYSYSVAARDALGNESEKSDAFSATTKEVGYQKDERPGVPKKPDAKPLPYPNFETTDFAEPVLTYKGVYPAPGSEGVDADETVLLIDFTAEIDFRYASGDLQIIDMVTGKVVHTHTPDPGHEDEDGELVQGVQGGYVLPRYVIELAEGILQPDTQYGVRIDRNFASVNVAPYDKPGYVDELQWQFKTAPSFSLLTIEGTTSESLLSNGDFENGLGGLDLSNHRVSGQLSTGNAIEGNQSVDLLFDPSYGRALAPYFYGWGQEVHGVALQAYAEVRIPEGNHVDSSMKLCSVAYYQDGEKIEACEVVPGTATDTIPVEVVLELDPTRNVTRVYNWIQFLENGPFNVTVDNLHLVMYEQSTTD